ncbi:MAG: dehydrogenase [Epulopiscium sp. Nuni2H_MBin003]|nr:MAG: dehydrogenase [Epulopiscium sp. Nuni2H_MBin003]
MKIIIIGAVAAGTSAAAKARRNNEFAEIVIYDRDTFISYSSCGMPYYIGGQVDDIDDLTPRDVEFFKSRYRINIKTSHEVIDINAESKTVTVKDLENNNILVDTYDKLVIATGARARVPNIKGINNAFCLRSIKDAQDIKHFATINKPKTALVVGTGFIGLELYESLIKLNLDVTLLEQEDRIMPTFDADMSKYLKEVLKAKGVKIRTSIQVIEISEKYVKLNTGEIIQTEMVVIATGVEPNVSLAKSVGIILGKSGAIKVDKHMKTSIKDIYACGDCVETFSMITGKPMYRAMGTIANKTGRIAGDVITGGTLSYRGGLGTSVCKVFETTIGSTGMTEAEAIALGIEVVVCHNIKPNRPLYMDGREMVIKAIADKKFGKLLGAQIIGEYGVDKRIDVIATLITYEAKVNELFDLDLSYAPPFSTAKDPVVYTGMILNNAINENRQIVTIDNIQKLGDNIQLVDVRTEHEYNSSHIEGAINIPHDMLREKLALLDKDKIIIVYCNKGVTGNAAQNILLNYGFTKVYNISGGHKFYNGVTNQIDFGSRDGATLTSINTELF